MTKQQVTQSPMSAATRIMDAVLRTLGRYSAQEHLLAVLKTYGFDTGDLLRVNGHKPYTIGWPQEGLSLILQKISLEPASGVSLGAVGWQVQAPAGSAASAGQSQGSAHAQAADSATGQWGLHGLILEAATWPGAWPGKIEPQSITPQGLLQAFKAEPQASLCLPELVSTQVHGVGGQTWSASAVFENGKLESLTLMRIGDWIGASILAPWSATGY